MLAFFLLKKEGGGGCRWGLALNRSICVGCAVRGSSAVCRRGYSARGVVTGARQVTSLVFAATMFGTVCSPVGQSVSANLLGRSLWLCYGRLVPGREGAGRERAWLQRPRCATPTLIVDVLCQRNKNKRRLLGPPCRWRVLCHRGSVADVSVCVASEYFCPSQWRGGYCPPPNGKWTPVSGGGDWSDDGLSWGCVPVLLLFFCLLVCFFSPTVSAVCLWLWVLWKGSLSRSRLACISLQQWGHKEHLYNAKAAQTCCHQQRWPIGSNVYDVDYFSCSKMRQSTLNWCFDYVEAKILLPFCCF